jgi:hypothetical protein
MIESIDTLEMNEMKKTPQVHRLRIDGSGVFHH